MKPDAPTPQTIATVTGFLNQYPLDPQRFPGGRRTLTALIAFRLDASEAALIADPDRALPEPILQQLVSDVAQLNAGKPIAYLYGSQPFLEWDFIVDERVLIPRPETEYLADLVRRELAGRPPGRILDLCTGSGALGCAAALSFPDAVAVLTDLSQPALAVAETNIRRLALGDRVRTARGDLWQAVAEEPPFDLILANPPYVAESDELDAAVRDFEPHIALFSDDGGTAHIKALIAKLTDYLKPGGLAAFELGHYHAKLLPPWLAPYHADLQFQWVKDPFDVPRYLFCRRPKRDGATH